MYIVGALISTYSFMWIELLAFAVILICLVLQRGVVLPQLKITKNIHDKPSYIGIKV